MTGKVDLKLEVVVVPRDVRVVQYTPPGSLASIHVGKGDTSAEHGSYASFSGPDGNGWVLQEITTRPPGRIDSDTYAGYSVAQ